MFNLELSMREKVFRAEVLMKQMPQLELKHFDHFSYGLYARELKIPKGNTLNALLATTLVEWDKLLGKNLTVEQHINEFAKIIEQTIQQAPPVADAINIKNIGNNHLLLSLNENDVILTLEDFIKIKNDVKTSRKNTNLIFNNEAIKYASLKNNKLKLLSETWCYITSIN